VSSPARRGLRPALVILHRWVGLVLAGFLVLAGLTGALLVWVEELDAAVSPALLQVEPTSAAPLDPLALREAVQAAHPEAYVALVPLGRKPGRSAVFRLYPRPLEGQARGSGAEPPNDQVFVDPYTGRILGARKWGDIGQGLKNLVPFLYRLHFSLALDVVGSYVFGVVALLWMLDCVVGAWLTLPPGRGGGGARRWLARWWPAWQVRRHAGAYKLNFDLHRAGGLWLWAVLFVIAWSSVAFNLSDEVYEPVMKRLLDHQPDRRSLPPARQPRLQPALDWPAALATGRRLMAEQARLQGFTIKAETMLVHDLCCGPRGAYRYQVQSSRDIRDHWGSTQLLFDADTGALLQLWLPTGAAAGDTVRMWLTSLHMAAVWGLPFRLFMTVVGLLVPVLAVTGVVVWARKRRGRRAPARLRWRGEQPHAG
jgi:uncharacterized iron-regulated membrane protein